jgi:hypothetical protein
MRTPSTGIVRLVAQPSGSYNAIRKEWCAFRPPGSLGDSLMSTPPVDRTRRWTAAELRRLPADQRDAILAAAAQAAHEYRNDASLTAFEAFGEGDLYVNSSDAQPR